jgi:hypothetical protein
MASTGRAGEPSSRSSLKPGFLKPAFGLAGFMAVGALAAFLVIGLLIPWIQGLGTGRPPASSAAARAGGPSPRICDGSLVVSPPITTPAATATSSGTPDTAWVNAPLGVHLRAAPSTAAAVVTTLSQGAAVAVDSSATDASGSTWYHARVGATIGWVRSDFMTDYAVMPAGDSQGWSGLVPDGMGDRVQAGFSDLVPGPAAPLPFARIQSSADGTPAPNVPAVLRASTDPIPVRTSTIQVWNYTAEEQVARVALDPCQVQVTGRADAGWPFETTVIVRAVGRTYRFTLWSSAANDVRVANFLSSLALH